jgi:hypothetical protein
VAASTTDQRVGGKSCGGAAVVVRPGFDSGIVSRKITGKEAIVTTKQCNRS